MAMKSLFLILLLASITTVLAQTEQVTPAPATQQTPVAQVPEEFTPFGVKITVPGDWKRLPEGQADSVGRWAVLKPGSTTEVDAIVTVEMSAARGRTAETAGAELAKHFKGTVDKDAELAGDKASRITGTLGAPKTTKPVESLVSRHGDFIYILSAAGTEGGMAHSQALQDLRQGFEFVPITSPTERMDLRPDGITVFKRLTIKPLSTLRPTPDQKPNIVQMRVFNYRRSRPDLVVTMEIVSASAGLELERAGTEIAVRSGASKDDLSWKEVTGTPRRIMSSPFKIANRNMPVRIGLVQLGPEEIGMINFGLVTPDDYDRVLYEAKCEEMLQSVEVLKK
jgi:hypothetical protein